MKFIRCAALVALLAPGPAAAQDFDAGLRAYTSGDYATALQEWRPLAEQGNASAQIVLGFMYDQGRGVAQDYVEAVRGFAPPPSMVTATRNSTPALCMAKAAVFRRTM